jgi:HSP20 family protein
MTDIDETVHKLETFYHALTGRPVAQTDVPYAPIPPERNADQYVSEQIDRLLTMLSPAAGPAAVGALWVPPVTIWEGSHDVWIRADVPGTPRDAISVSIQQNLLTISGSRLLVPPGGEAAGVDAQLRRCESAHGRFRRQIVLPNGLVTDQMSATFKDGVVEIQVPRAVPTVVATRTIPVQ